MDLYLPYLLVGVLALRHGQPPCAECSCRSAVRAQGFIAGPHVKLDQPMPGGSCGPAAIDNKARNDDESNVSRRILQLM
jgi:hypothetical protein